MFGKSTENRKQSNRAKLWQGRPGLNVRANVSAIEASCQRRIRYRSGKCPQNVARWTQIIHGIRDLGGVAKETKNICQDAVIN